MYTPTIFLFDYHSLLLPAHPNQPKETSVCSVITPKALCPGKEALLGRKPQ